VAGYTLVIPMNEELLIAREGKYSKHEW